MEENGGYYEVFKGETVVSIGYIREVTDEDKMPECIATLKEEGYRRGSILVQQEDVSSKIK